MSRLQQIRHKWLHPPQFKMLEDFTIIDDNGVAIINPAGFVYDGASVPRFLWPIIEPVGNLLEGSGPHDQYYQYGYLLTRWTPGLILDPLAKSLVARHKVFSEKGLAPVYVGLGQLFADDLLRRVTIVSHGATVDADRAYAALRLFGWITWGKYRENGPGVFSPNSLGLPGLTETAGVEVY
jgi:hypothetical protein